MVMLTKLDLVSVSHTNMLPVIRSMCPFLKDVGFSGSLDRSCERLNDQLGEHPPPGKVDVESCLKDWPKVRPYYILLQIHFLFDLIMFLFKAWNHVGFQRAPGICPCYFPRFWSESKSFISDELPERQPVGTIGIVSSARIASYRIIHQLRSV